jgi:hypothetical protein
MSFQKMIVCAIALLIFGTACKKSSTRPQQPAPDTTTNVVYADYMDAHPGNYWIYQYFWVDINGAAIALHFDSVYVANDTVIGRKKYHRLKGSNSSPSVFRDSLHYVVDDRGNIIFSSEDFSTVFNEHWYASHLIAPPPDDTVALVKSFIGDKDLVIEVPAGSFTTTAYLRQFNFSYPYNTKFGAKKNLARRYARNVGMIQEQQTISIFTGEILERRLVRYRAKKR